MSMKDCACSGYVLEAEKLLTCLDPEARKIAQLIIEDGNEEGFQDFCCKNLPWNIIRPSETFIFSDEDASDELECGKMYCRWDESDLYEKKEKPELRSMMQAIGCKPEFYQWTMWG